QSWRVLPAAPGESFTLEGRNGRTKVRPLQKRGELRSPHYIQRRGPATSRAFDLHHVIPAHAATGWHGAVLLVFWLFGYQRFRRQEQRRDRRRVFEGRTSDLERIDDALLEH